MQMLQCQRTRFVSLKQPGETVFLDEEELGTSRRRALEDALYLAALRMEEQK